MNQDLTQLLNFTRFVKADREDIVYLTGSIVEGFGNSSSDLDFYVITRAPLHNRPQIVIENLESLRLDIEYWEYDRVLRLAEKIDRMELNNPDKMPDLLSDAEADFCHRLKIAVPAQNGIGFEELRNHFDFKKFNEGMTIRYIRLYEGWAEDALGALESRDEGTACFVARRCLEAAMDAYLASRGETYARDKWRFRKMERQLEPGHEWTAKFWRLSLPGIEVRQNLGAYVEECLFFANQLIMEAQVGG